MTIENKENDEKRRLYLQKKLLSTIEDKSKKSNLYGSYRKNNGKHNINTVYIYQEDEKEKKEQNKMLISKNQSRNIRQAIKIDESLIDNKQMSKLHMNRHYSSYYSSKNKEDNRKSLLIRKKSLCTITKPNQVNIYNYNYNYFFEVSPFPDNKKKNKTYHDNSILKGSEDIVNRKVVKIRNIYNQTDPTSTLKSKPVEKDEKNFINQKNESKQGDELNLRIKNLKSRNLKADNIFLVGRTASIRNYSNKTYEYQYEDHDRDGKKKVNEKKKYHLKENKASISSFSSMRNIDFK